MDKLLILLFPMSLILFDLLSVSMEFTSSFSCYCSVKECGPRRVCKSRGMGCFSELANDSDIRTAQHGCLDLLSEEKQSQCQNVPGAAVSSNMGQKSLLLCCQKEMCNLDSEHYLILNQTSNLELPVPHVYSNQHLWYRAATIAVPICGLLILGMLILVGAKILKSDHIDERILMSKLREKQEQCTSSFNSASLNIVPLLPPRNPLLGVGVNINKLDHISINMNSNSTLNTNSSRGTHSNLLIGGNACRVNNCVSSLFNSGNIAPCGNNTVPSPFVTNSTRLEGTLNNPCGSPAETTENNAFVRVVKNCNAVPSDIIKDLEILDKPSSSSIPSCNLYSGRQSTYDPSVNSQPVVTDKINYKQSFISTWMTNERDVNPES